MGLGQSQRSPFTPRDRNNPKHFYLVVGGPQIKYIKGPQHNGPLLYNVNLDVSDAGPEKVEKAETIKNFFKISHKNGGIKLRPTTTGGDFLKSGYELSFIIDGTADMTCQVDVFVGAKVELKKGVGLTISNTDESSQKQFHICQQPGILADAGGLEFTCDEPIFLNRLQDTNLPSTLPHWSPGDFATPNGRNGDQGSKESSYVPVVIKVSYEADVNVSLSEVEYGETETPPPASASTVKQGQSFVTCILIEPKKVIEKAKDNHSNKIQEEDGSHKAIQVSQTRSFIQMSGEVYELNDIFDSGEGTVIAPKDKTDGAASPDPASGALSGDDEEDDEANLCVVCLTERKNTVIMPCRHMSLCADCAAQIKHMKGTCPVCRGPIEKLMAM